MAESAVFFLVEKLVPLLEKEVKLLTKFQKELVYVRDEFERMKAFLRVADAAEEDDEEIRLWVKQVRELAYDTEDLIDEFLYRFEHRRRHGVYGFLCKIARTVKTLKAHREIANEMRRIRSRVTTVSEGHQRYHYKLQVTKQDSRSTAEQSSTWFELRSDARLIDESQLVGLDSPKQDLITWLAEDVSELRVVTVVGMGGLGKTTLVSKVYDDLEVKKHFQHRAWVTVSQSFKLDELLRQIIQQLFDEIRQPLPQGADSTNNHILKKIIMDFLRGKRYLLVLDDIWGIDAWDALKVAFPNNNSGSRLMIATRIAEVASFSTKELRGRIYPLKPLSSEESWTLFCAKAFQGNPCPRHLKIISENILKRCEGLPLAIVALASMLATKNVNRIDEWEIVDRSLRAELQGNNKLKGVQAILSLSFNDLPCNLKYCFMYLSLFPEDYLIRRNILVRLWIAEGFVLETEGKVDEVADGYFNELLNRNLIQVGERFGDGRIRSCRVHDFFREIILLKSKEQNFAATISEESMNLPERVRRLSVHKGKEVDPSGDTKFYKLRSLLFFGEENGLSSNFLSSIFDHGLRLLKVMDCTGAPLSTFPKDITKLYHLRYLSLRNTNVRTIPHSIGELRNLETLDLKKTFIEELPAEILLLQRLRHVIVYRYGPKSPDGRILGFKALEGIGSLSSLRKLCFVEANRGGTDFLVSIGRLTQLTRFGILQLEAEHGHALCSSIGKLRYLRSLTLVSRKEDDILDLQFVSSSPSQSIQRLYMRGRLEKLPHWLLNLTNLVTLVLKFSMLQADPLESLQALPNLASLGFQKRAYDGEALYFKTGGFPVLRDLRVIQAKNLRRVTIEDGAMPHLEDLMFEDCKLLKEMPSGVERLRNLEYLYLCDMAEELTTTLYEGSQDENYLKVMHIPFLFVGQLDEEYEFGGRFL